MPIQIEKENQVDHPAFHCLRTLLKPVVRFCLRRSIQIQVLLESLKVLFVDLAKEELESLSKEVTISRLSVMTGIHRKDVKRIQSTEHTASTTPGVLSKTVGQWLHDSDFQQSNGEVRILSHGTQDSEFSDLVSRVNTDVNPATVLFELERQGLVIVQEAGVQLLAESYSTHADEQDGLNTLAQDIEYLSQAAEENIYNRKETPNLHRRTEYDNVNPAAVPELKRLLLQTGFDMHKNAREIISKYDRDISPDADFSGKGATVVIGSFSKVYTEEDK